jgi:hypothetical protein
MAGGEAMPSGLTFPSGPWTGYYQQDRSRFRQDLHLRFRNGVMSGGGSDPIGPFVVHGAYDEATGEATWTKRYVGGHAVLYRGFRELMA